MLTENDADHCAGLPLRARVATDIDDAHRYTCLNHTARCLHNLIDLGGQIEVLLRQAASIVGGQAQRHLTPANIDIGMVSGRFGEEGDVDDKRNAEGNEGS